MKLLFITGTRAEFGKLLPLADEAAINGHEITFLVTGMHMLSKYGLTKAEVLRSGHPVVEFMNQSDHDPMDLAIAKTIIGVSDIIREHSPDVVVYHGDRLEALATAIVCATNYIRSIHIEGGEVSGTIDELFRHCNTKLANLHMVSSQTARDRLIAMGEDPSRIAVIGSPELDLHAAPSGVSIDTVKKHYEIPYDEYGIVSFHPVTSERKTIGIEADALFKGLLSTGYPFVVIRPNNDPGAEIINGIIDSLPTKNFRIIPSMRFSYFSELLKNASVFIGNSSAVVREGPFLGLTCINIGTRQHNRSNDEHLINIRNPTTKSIMSSVIDSWGKRRSMSCEFGVGNATKEFARLLKNTKFMTQELQKHYYEPSSND